jgi:hypothetical protein
MIDEQLIKDGCGEEGREREFLVFGDLVVWFEREGASHSHSHEHGWGLFTGSRERRQSWAQARERPRSSSRPGSKTRSDSKTRSAAGPPNTKPKKAKRPPPTSSLSPMADFDPSSSAYDPSAKWVYKGRVDLVDLDLVVRPHHFAKAKRRFSRREASKVSMGGGGATGMGTGAEGESEDESDEEEDERWEFEMLSPDGSFLVWTGG